LSGAAKIKEFFDALQSVGTPPSWTDCAVSVGPLAEFDGAARWVPTPARNGIVLIGDAAAASDPSWGSGLALTLVDVEHLSNALTSTNDWSAAIARYAHEHDAYFAAMHRIHEWMTDLSWTPGPEADERRGRVLPKWLTQADGYPDLVGLGPFGPSDERARRLILGLD
jgi:2-polyprenyl-6-methoxyphenol hydroxylase-like FAD-dependent oxidoreductase